MSTRTAPRTLHAVAAYVIAPHDGEDTGFYRAGDPVVHDTLGWEYWPDGMAENYGRNRALSLFTAWAADANTPDEDGGRIGALLATITVPESARSDFENAATDEEASENLNAWMDTIEWERNWIAPEVEPLRMTPAFQENRERIIARTAERESAA